MTRRHRLSDEGVLKLKPKAKRYTFADPELPGHYVRVHVNGSKHFCVVTRDPRGKQHWRVIGSPPMSIDDARDIGRKVIRSIREAAPDSFEGVAKEWFKRHVLKRGLRSASEIERFLKQHLCDGWAGRDFVSIGRKDVAALLDHIEDDHGARQADYALAVVRQICNWYATRDENYSSPIVKGMRRTNPKEIERKRILSDDEICAIWNAAGDDFVWSPCQVPTTHRTASRESRLDGMERSRRQRMDNRYREARKGQRRRHDLAQGGNGGAGQAR